MEHEPNMTRKYHKATGSRAIVAVFSKRTAHALRDKVLYVAMIISLVI
jgi:hypothetical protein